ncbi:hypothetical protein BC831DRAFT_456848 [Entophlyctis helioformis]|nr:hypothetical protein BC831DRAFT_456848 [Entophlyctis helioformis]
MRCYNPISLLDLIREQESHRVDRFANGKQLPPMTIQKIMADICRASSCLLQLLGYIDAFQVNSGILATGQHMWFVRRDTSATNRLSFFVSKSVPGDAGPPVTLRRALFYTLNEFALKPGADAPEPTDGLPPPAPGPATGPATGPTTGPAPGQADAPPASGPASGSASGSAPEPSRRDGYATYATLLSGGRTLVANDSGVNLMHSPKPTLHLHGVIGRGRTGTVWIGCFDGERVAVKQVVLHDLDDTNYRKIRREVLFYGKCKDLWGDAIPDVKEAILSRHHAFLVMELGQPCMAWGDQDRRLAEQALNKLHARRILHRDLHSGNVVFVGEGDERKARIVDLESARFEHGWDFEELAAKEKARVARFGTPTEYDRRHVE